MLVLILTATFAQQPTCLDEGAALAEATARAEALDSRSAVALLDTPTLRGCAGAEIATLYLKGLQAARDASRRGGDPTSLEPVRDAIARLTVHAGGAPGPADIARLVLLAAAAAAQSERDEMGVFLEHAVAAEALQLGAREPGAPVITAHEVSGDLWLQVHQYERARLAYMRAVEQVGAKPRLTLGLARAAVRLKEAATACAEYRTLLKRWHWAADGPTEIAEARRYLRQRLCGLPKNAPR